MNPIFGHSRVALPSRHSRVAPAEKRSGTAQGAEESGNPNTAKPCVFGLTNSKDQRFAQESNVCSHSRVAPAEKRSGTAQGAEESGNPNTTAFASCVFNNLRAIADQRFTQESNVCSHSREGGNPNTRSVSISNLRSAIGIRRSLIWIPAFAGMTAVARFTALKADLEIRRLLRRAYFIKDQTKCLKHTHFSKTAVLCHSRVGGNPNTAKPCVLRLTND